MYACRFILGRDGWRVGSLSLWWPEMAQQYWVSVISIIFRLLSPPAPLRLPIPPIPPPLFVPSSSLCPLFFSLPCVPSSSLHPLLLSPPLCPLLLSPPPSHSLFPPLPIQLPHTQEHMFCCHMCIEQVKHGRWEFLQQLLLLVFLCTVHSSDAKRYSLSCESRTGVYLNWLVMKLDRLQPASIK